MKQRRRIYYTEAQKGLMWDRWQKQAVDAVAYRLFEPEVRQLVHAVEQRDRLPGLQVLLQDSLIEMGGRLRSARRLRAMQSRRDRSGSSFKASL